MRLKDVTKLPELSIGIHLLKIVPVVTETKGSSPSLC